MATPYENALIQALLDEASIHGDERVIQRFVTKLTGAHHQQSQGEIVHMRDWLNIFPKGRREKYRAVIERASNAWKNSHRDEFHQDGYVDLLGPGAHVYLQEIATAAGHRVTGGVIRRQKEDERRKSFWEKLGFRGEIK